MTTMSTNRLTPFLKWAGGKRWLVRAQPDLFNVEYNNYYEPFLGGGAVFFHLEPSTAILSDKNEHLINLYNQIKSAPKELYNELKKHQELHSKEYYYLIRSARPDCPTKRAAQFLYLNRTCWNGLFRVNLKGDFNVPIGTKSTVIIQDENFEEISKRLRNATIFTGDFEATIDKAGNGDLLFVDPPYTVKHNNNGFVKYNESIFSWDDQERLAASLTRADARGVKIISTNADHKSVRSLYQDKLNIHTVSRASVLAGKSSARTNTTEILITNQSFKKTANNRGKTTIYRYRS